MSDDLENVAGANPATGTSEGTTNNKADSSRVKRMRGWLGIKSSVETRSFGGGGEPLIDVDAPNGWNR